MKTFPIPPTPQASPLPAATPIPSIPTPVSPQLVDLPAATRDPLAGFTPRITEPGFQGESLEDALASIGIVLD